MPTNNRRIWSGFVSIAAFVALALAPSGASAACHGGGITPAEIDICTPTPKARLLDNGMLIPPKAAPLRVKQTIEYANRIRNKPYIYGGGHASFQDKGYDCSGSVSYALRGGGFLESPVPSTTFMNWGMRGDGRWITIYSNPGHAYAVIAGYRWDTSGNTDGKTGPSWHEELRNNVGYVVRHPAGF